MSRLMREEAGATIHVGAEVERLLVEEDRVIGIRLVGGTEIRSRVVVSNLDPKRTFLKLLPSEYLADTLSRRIGSLVTQVSCYKFLAIISELPRWQAWDGNPDLPSTGSVGLTKTRADVRAVFDDLDAGRPARTPLISFSVPSTLDASLTQPGYHTASL